MELAFKNMRGMSMPQYRSEWKYICTDGQLELIRERLDNVLQKDIHTSSTGSYSVHSLYFDDLQNSCAAGNESGDGIRYKYRIRYYENQQESMHLERKEKRYGFGGKKICPLSMDSYAALLSGDISELFWSTEDPLLKKFCALIWTKGFSPKSIIDYERTAFTEPAEHIRITLDRNITAAYDCESFLSSSYLRYPLQNANQNILEVKFDSILPGWLYRMLESLNIQQTTFSKYYLGRKRLEHVLK